jgi:biotin carboxyl carrier protein
MDYQYQTGEEILTARLETAGLGYTVTVGGRTFQVERASLHDGELRLIVDGQRLTLIVAADGPRRWVAFAGQVYAFSVPQAERKSRRTLGAGHKHDTLEAQMPGVVRQVLVAAGDMVTRGQPLLVLEAMKMEIKIAAPHAGRVEQIAVSAGASVQRGQLLAEIEEAEA